MQHLNVNTSASLDEHCPMSCATEGSDFVTVMIGNAAQSIELLLNAEGARKLAEVSNRAVAEMDALFAHEERARS